MKIVEIQEELDLGSAAFPRRKPGEDPVRTQGLHLTDIIADLMEASGMKKTASGSLWAPNQLDLAAEVGFLWEETLSNALKDRLPFRLGEVTMDGIILSPDGLEFEPEWGMELSEYKCVWASARRSPIDNAKWMFQVKGYCKALGVEIVKMYILYLNGDFKGSGPIYKRFRIIFTPLEIEENWDMIINHARSRKWL